MIGALTAPTGEARTHRALFALVFVVTLARLGLASSLGLGVDEAYTVATARTFALGTFDHPPLTWWISGGAAKLFSSEAPVVVRLPFIALGALSLLFAYDAGRTLYGPRAGLYAAIAITLAPVLGWTSGSMVLPDAPLLAAFLGGLCCLSRALFGAPEVAWRWWLLAGAAAGIACLAKLHGIFLLAGTGLFLLTSPPHRRWLTSPWPYLAAFVALVIASPFLIWNAEHDWISFAFQASRARARRFDLLGPFTALGGQALFLLPWVWGALVISLVRAAGQGPRQPRDWLLVCLASGPIAGFTLIALLGTRPLFHWAAPGYLFLCVLLGRDLARDLAQSVVRAERWLKFSTAAIVVLFAGAVVAASRPWPAPRIGSVVIPDPLQETRSWQPLAEAVLLSGALGTGMLHPGTVVAGLKWHEAGRLAVAFGPGVPVICLCLDPRGFGILADNRKFIGRDVLVIGDGGASETVAVPAAYFVKLSPADLKTAPGFALWRGSSLRDPGLPVPNLLRPFVKAQN